MKQDFTTKSSFSSFGIFSFFTLTKSLFQWLRQAPFRLRDLTPNAIEKLHKAFVGHLASAVAKENIFRNILGFQT